MILTALSAFAAPTITDLDLASEADIVNEGELVEAFVYTNSGNDFTINGIPFVGFFPKLAGWSSANNGWCSTCPAPYNTFLDDLMYQGNSVSTQLSIAGLTVGEDYRLQLIMGNDDNQTGYGEVVQFQGEEFTMDWAGQPYAVVIEFTAEAATETVVFPSNGNSQPDRAVLTAWALHHLDFVRDTVNEAAGFGGVIDEGNGFNFRPSTINANLDALAQDYAGCSTEQIAGTWVRGRSPRVFGVTPAGDSAVGPNITNLDIEGTEFSASLESGGTFSGMGEDGSWFSGNFARLGSKRSIWYGVIASCP